ncbi:MULTISPECIES: hypothetical protein [Pantoea]|jgi:succinate dehydrogenase/fumarate reductase flavoprotein subunit|uniref:Uncharacterized protein n=1 Tax=Pantoea brenneri TaxID=472694 RepID=A0A7Y6NH29_9GAMM|nr:MULTISPECIES: hypothetical protein [Pantoea]MBZ6397033.1 hypothetical protein [Pantoea sp.]MBZ6440216.1 hypothetical protein [Pantoea sp.]NUY43422.1 hypothetical protein [Pantoea brenneri]NUY51012.1 hypothetical protein [Pantoea brenneri]NUY61257.1 hypothetical protein [Pantoea brenneri]
MHELLINAASHVEDTHHLSAWLGIGLIGVAIIMAVFASVQSIHHWLIIRKRWKLYRTAQRHFPYHMRKRRH